MENWRQFCVQYAKSVALKFAENWRQFCSKNINNVSADVIVKQFTETLSEELNQHLTLSSSAPVCCELIDNDSAEQPCTSLQSSSKRPASIADMSFLVRSCKEFSSLRKNFELATHNRTSSRPSSTRLSWLRSKFSSKRNVEVIKEAQLRFISGLELETKEWRKCRTCLVKTAGGSLLEFYSPPKSTRAKTGIFCFLIMEIREATRLEFEDASETIFVIRAFNGVEYAVETRSRDDCEQWINAIKESIPGIEWNSSNRMIRQPSAPPIGMRFHGKRPFLTSRSLSNVPAMVNTVLTDGPTTTVASLHIQRLSMFPWFHLHLSRTASERLLLYNGVDGHGLFLVRQSETRPGDFVLSFNCGGKANHVRINMLPSGDCRAHQLRFRSVVELLEHFRNNPIPLESLSNPPMFLREYIICTLLYFLSKFIRTAENRLIIQASSSSCWRRRSLLLSDDQVDIRDFLTYSGPVSMDITDLEKLVIKELTARRQRASFRTLSVNRYKFV
ncbi:unnamed protein product [Enterobius vermicularis]|uniref:SH2B adapter protein 2 n=1 Tax=Enterobius vermicularis TaxID=51028 RepID=A0A0N4VHF5_ENTVE|nr:unnamed protein product [Enterobius vermicularis]